MGKNKGDSKGGRREPCNEPIKVYGVASPEGSAALREIMGQVRRGLREVRLGRAIDVKVGNNIGYKRTRAGLSVEQFAARMKMSVARLKKIEAGKGKLTLSLTQRLASALGCFLHCELV
jgi:ribosome-binding protein aMBF1 (putative translation factor)